MYLITKSFPLLFFPQSLKHVHVSRVPLLDRFALLISISLIWAYAHILTVGGAYKNQPARTQLNCRTDRANLISSAPWFVLPEPSIPLTSFSPISPGFFSVLVECHCKIKISYPLQWGGKYKELNVNI